MRTSWFVPNQLGQPHAERGELVYVGHLADEHVPGALRMPGTREPRLGTAGRQGQRPAAALVTVLSWLVRIITSRPPMVQKIGKPVTNVGGVDLP